MKTCRKCNRSLSVEMFYANPRTKDGRFHFCRECWSKTYAVKNKLNGIEFEQHTYLTVLDPPRTFEETRAQVEERLKSLPPGP